MAEKRAAIVTGAGQGIGKTIAARFLEDGYDVVIAEKNAKTGRATEKELSQFGKALFIPTDVGDETSVKNLVHRVMNFFGRIDVLVNNAGAFNFKPLERLMLADWHEVIETNLTGNFLCAKYAAPHLRKTNGAIVNISSTRALMSEPGKEAYAASKGGIVALTHALAISLGPNVRVNCISPDWIDSGKEPVKPSDHDQFPAGRVGETNDVASMALFLCDPRNSFITGANFILDGGKTRQMSYEPN